MLVNPVFYVITFLFLIVAVSIYFIFFNKKSSFKDVEACLIKKYKDYYEVDDITNETIFNKIKTILFCYDKRQTYKSGDIDGYFDFYSLSDKYCRAGFYMDSFEKFSEEKSNLGSFLFSEHDAKSLLNMNTELKKCFIRLNCPPPK